MLKQRSFSEIFEEIHSENQGFAQVSESSDKINSGWESALEPSHMAYLMGQLNKAPMPTPVLNKVYKPRPRPSHILNDEQSAAFQVIHTHAPRLRDNFNLHELRSAYRLSVLKTHPDQGGTPESFQAVKKSYEILWAFVNT